MAKKEKCIIKKSGNYASLYCSGIKVASYNKKKRKMTGATRYFKTFKSLLKK